MAQTDLGLRSRTFSLKIYKLPTFSEINQVGNVQKLCLYGHIISHIEFQRHIMF